MVAIEKNDFIDKVVIVTGSSRGIGKAIALEFLKAGASVALNGRNPESLERAVNYFREKGYDPMAVPGDVSDPVVCQQLVDKTMMQYGRIDILVNNAGGGFRGLISNTDPGVFKRVIDSNLMSAVYCTRAALEAIKESKGSIIFISSLSGIRGMPGNAPYSISKMGLTALAEALKTELRNDNVHIGILMVGFTDYDDEKRVTSSDGTLIPIERKSEQTREHVAKIVLKTVKKRRFRVVLTRLGFMLDMFQRISPGFVEWILRKSDNVESFNK